MIRQGDKRLLELIFFWYISSVFFKSAWNNSNVDCSNNRIKYLGVFKTSLLTDIILTTISLSNAIKVLEFDSKISYSAAQISSNNGFDTNIFDK